MGRKVKSIANCLHFYCQRPRATKLREMSFEVMNMRKSLRNIFGAEKKCLEREQKIFSDLHGRRGGVICA
jgi:hypothetical protein